MPYARPTLTQLRQQAQQDVLDGGIPGVSSMLRFSVLYVLSMTLAGLAWLHYGYLDWIARQAVPWTATGEWLAAWGALKGVIRKAPTAASSSAITFTATGSNIVPAGTSIILTGGLTATTTADSVTANGQTVAPATCTTTGSAGNVPAGATVTLSSPVPGIQTMGTVSAPFTGGADIETEDDFRTRVLGAYQDSERIGTEADYKQWALAVSGVTRAWVVRNGFGTGSVVVYVMLDAANAAQGGLPQGSNGCATQEWRYTTATGDQLRVANALWDEQPATPLVVIMSPALQPTDFVISDLGANNTADNKNLITAALQDMFERVSGPGVTISPNQWQEAIAAIGLSAYNIASPSAPIVANNISSMPSLGALTLET
ncbi:baseplate J/gp47 family protein [Acetobacter persici]|uniref:baseplate J/gp47 family protein n=1 Tax=Acetobacter persici TaxID=1076596 RepID=UPI0036D8124B